MSHFLRSTTAALGGLLGSTGRANRAGWIAAENQLTGSVAWRKGADDTRPADDNRMQIKGYASATSISVGESVDFHVSVSPAQDFTIAIHRLGYYRGHDARHLVTSPVLHGVTEPEPDLNPTTGMISCRWRPVWTLRVPRTWVSGLYLAVFTTRSNWRSYTPFVVRDDRQPAKLCVLLPFSTYQAYNQWPLDGRRGKSLYYGFEHVAAANATAGTRGGGTEGSGKLDFIERALKVSFDRPYSRDGLPNRFDFDRDFVRWVERSGYDVTYADSLDLHNGRIEPSRYTGLVFCGHDEYWSRQMRESAAKALSDGTSLAFLTANNIYWHVRVEPSADGRDNRIVVCYKKATDPAPDIGGTTTQWRDRHPGPADPEQALLGVQYNGIVPAPVPLVVQAADHWFWGGSEVQDGDEIAHLVGGEADGVDPRHAGPPDVNQTLLSASPYKLQDGTPLVQNTSLYETRDGAIVFVAGTLEWPAALSRDGRKDQRVQTATANLFNRMLGRSVAPARPAAPADRSHPLSADAAEAAPLTLPAPVEEAPDAASSVAAAVPNSCYETLYQKGGFGYDAQIDTWRPWVQKHYVAEFGLKSGMRLLDVGCGDGFWAMLLAEHGIEVTGVDQALAGIEVARERLPGARFVQANIKDPLPFDPGSFDVAFMRGLSCLASPDIDSDSTVRQLTNVARTVRPGGLLLASTYTTLSGQPDPGSKCVSHRVSTVVAAIEQVAVPVKMVRVSNYLQIAAHPREDL